MRRDASSAVGEGGWARARARARSAPAPGDRRTPRGARSREVRKRNGEKSAGVRVAEARLWVAGGLGPRLEAGGAARLGRCGGSPERRSGAWSGGPPGGGGEVEGGGGWGSGGGGGRGGGVRGEMGRGEAAGKLWCGVLGAGFWVRGAGRSRRPAARRSRSPLASFSSPSLFSLSLANAGRSDYTSRGAHRARVRLCLFPPAHCPCGLPVPFRLGLSTRRPTRTCSWCARRGR